MDLAERERAYIRFSGGPAAVAVDVLDRCKALEDRGLSHDLARDLYVSGNVTLLGRFETLTDAQILAVTATAADVQVLTTTVGRLTAPPTP